jgi:dimethylaniline monooxygenase (N-oxide forming)
MAKKDITICVIGSGASGLPSIKSCLEQGFQVVCFEKTDQIGGLWRYRDQVIDGLSRVQKSTITNSSKELNSFSDFPMPKEFPNYSHNTDMTRYFELYAEKFDLFSHIKFEHKVTKVEKNSDYENTHKWKVYVKNVKEKSNFNQVFDGVMVCTGHHVIPRWAKFPGQESFKGMSNSSL